jgi:hypothetical protein
MNRLASRLACRALTLTVCICTPLTSLAAGYLVGVPVGYTPGTAPLVHIDPASGAYTTVATVGNSYHALAQDSHGDFYGGYFATTASNGRVARINPATGAPAAVFNAVTPGAGDIRGLAFDQTDQLFAVVNRDDNSGSPTLPDDLYQINLVAQTTSLVGSLGFLGVQGFDAAPNGDLFAWDGTAGLLRVNPATGAAVDVNPAIGGTASIQSIVFAPDGRLFGARHALFAIDPLTGAFTQIGPGGGPDVRGIEWVVPEPSSALLAAIAMDVLRTARRRGVI